MKQYLSFLHLSNLLGSKMRKGMKNFCNDDGSTSTLNQHYYMNGGSTSSDHHHKNPCVQRRSSSNSSSTKGGVEGRSATLEEMILQVELEEEMARRAKLKESIGFAGRMSCVDSCDILRSARNALNQYPRFSLDGRDAMYRASFRDLDAPSAAARGIRSSVCCDQDSTSFDPKKSEKTRLLGLPTLTVGGESVVWCKPGVVAQLMGLEEVPVPLSSFRSVRGGGGGGGGKDRVMMMNSSSVAMMTRQKNLRRRAQRHEMETIRLSMNNNNTNNGSCSSSSSKPPGFSVMKPVVAYGEGEGGWPTRRFH